MTSSPPNSVTEKHLGRTHAQPLRRCTTKNHLEAKDVEAEDVDDVAAWPLAEADADALGDVQGREGPEADQALVSQAAEDVEAEDVDDVAAWPLAEADADALGDVEGREGVSQAAEDGVLLEADVVAEPPRDVDDVAAWPLAEADADVLGDVEGREGPEADRALVAQAAEDAVLLEADVVGEPRRDVDDDVAWRLSLRLTRTCAGTSTTSRLGRSPRRTRTRRGTSKAAKGRKPIERSCRRPPRTSKPRMSTTSRLGGSRQG